MVFGKPLTERTATAFHELPLLDHADLGIDPPDHVAVAAEHEETRWRNPLQRGGRVTFQ